MVQWLLAEGRHALGIEMRLIDETALTREIMAQSAAEAGSPAAFRVGIDPSPELAARLLADHVPVVNGTDPCMRFDGVAPANFFGAEVCARLLLDQGHRSLLYVTSPPRWATLERLRGFQAAVAAVPGARGKVSELTAPSREAAEAAIREALQAAPRDWTAVFCVNDLFAIGVLRALETARLRVPQDVSVVGFDALPYAAITSPRLSTLRVDRQEIGCQAIRLMLRRLEEPEATPLQIAVGVTATPGGALGPPPS